MSDGLQYITGKDDDGWNLYRISCADGDTVKVKIASFGKERNAEWKAERAAERKNLGAFA